MKHVHWAALLLCASVPAFAVQIGDGPTIEEHMSEAAIESGQVELPAILLAGQHLFTDKFNMYDGQGRPATTGGGAHRLAGSAPVFVRTSSPESNSCAGCHNDPFVGGAGDIVANVFVLAQTLDPITESVSPNFSNERNTLGMNGSGAIEMLAREMTVQLHAQRSQLQSHAVAGTRSSVALIANGVSFGQLAVDANGVLDTSGVVGVDKDLVIKPFHQKGVVVSVREFTNNAMNHHHGMQSVERFGFARTQTDDFDEDGVSDELTVGDMTAVTLFQTALSVPGQVLPNDLQALVAVIKGERSFDNLGCSGCHVPSMNLQTRDFIEPNPYNPPGNLSPADVQHMVSYDMTTDGMQPRLEAMPGGGAVVRAYTDLKRHNLCDDEIRFYCNEKLIQAGVPTEQFLTRKLWDVGNTAPYGHRGDLTTMTEAIEVHGGEARASRDAFMAMTREQKAEVIEFLKTLRILPPGTPSLVVDSNGTPTTVAALKRLLRLENNPN
jgi:hypothetical protein